MAEGEAAAAGVPADRMPIMTWEKTYTPSTFNTEALTRQVSDTLAARFGKDKIVALPASMGGEDFSQYYLADPSIESSFFWIGAVKHSTWDAVKGDVRKLPSIHSAKFAPDPEPTIQTGVEAMTAAALSVLTKGGGQ